MYDTDTDCDSRSSVDEAKWTLILYLAVVRVVAACYVLLKVLVDSAGVVLDLDLPNAGHSQKEILIVDEGVSLG